MHCFKTTSDPSSLSSSSFICIPKKKLANSSIFISSLWYLLYSSSNYIDRDSSNRFLFSSTFVALTVYFSSLFKLNLTITRFAAFISWSLVRDFVLILPYLENARSGSADCSFISAARNAISTSSAAFEVNMILHWMNYLVPTSKHDLWKIHRFLMYNPNTGQLLW